MNPIFRITGTDETAPAWNSAQLTATKAIGNIKGLIPGLGAALSAAGMIHFAEEALEAGEQMDKLSQRTGVGVEELSAFKYVLDQADIPIEAFALSMKKLSVSSVEALDKNSEQAAMFRTLGVSVQDANGKMRPTLEIMLSLADKFSKSTDGATKTAAAVKILGKTGDELIPFLNMGRERIVALTQEANRLGLVMSSETAQAAAEASDNIKMLRTGAEAMTVTFVNEAAPAIARITAAMREAKLESGTLTSLWVGLGGVAAELFGLGMKEAAENARDLQRGIADLTEDQRKNREELAKWPDSDILLKTDKFLQATIERKKAELKVFQDQVNEERQRREKAQTDIVNIEQRGKDQKAVQTYIDNLKKEAAALSESKEEQIKMAAAQAAAKIQTADLAEKLVTEAGAWAKKIALLQAAKTAQEGIIRINNEELAGQDKARAAVFAEIDTLENSSDAWNQSSEERKNAALLADLVRSGIGKESEAYRYLETRLNAASEQQKHFNELREASDKRIAGIKTIEDETRAIEFETATLRLNNDQKERAQLIQKMTAQGVSVLSDPQGSEAMDKFDAAQAAREQERRRIKIEQDKQTLDQKTSDLILSLRTDEEIEQAHFVAENDMLAQAWAQRLITENQYQAALERLRLKYGQKSLEQRYNEEKAKAGATRIYGQVTLNDAEFFANQMGAMMQSKSRAAFEIGKAGAIAGAVIDTYKAATGAYAALAGIPIIGPALGAAAAAAAIVVGLARVQQIKSTQFGSSNGGAVGTFAASPSTGLPESPTSSGFDQGVVPVSSTQAAPVQTRRVEIALLGLNDSGAPVSQKWIRESLLPGIKEAIGDGVTFETS